MKDAHSTQTPSTSRLETQVNRLQQNNRNKQGVFRRQQQRQNASKSESRSKITVCYCCGMRNNHITNDCRFRYSICNFCNKKGNLEKACIGKHGKSIFFNNINGNLRNDTDNYSRNSIYSSSEKSKRKVKHLKCKHDSDSDSEIDYDDAHKNRDRVDYVTSNDKHNAIREYDNNSSYDFLSDFYKRT